MTTLDELPSAEQARVMAVWAETSKLRASCLAHRRVVGWEPAPMWWYHTSDLSTCSAGWSAPAPIPRDGPPWRPASSDYYGASANALSRLRASVTGDTRQEEER